MKVKLSKLEKAGLVAMARDIETMKKQFNDAVAELGIDIHKPFHINEDDELEEIEDAEGG